ncbi:unnamed protein product [Clavelina lepadiformis]|uniref:G-protein coupled receptors family 1 profile domain-containing protein n=1 Tax=Clavelina lepadiformis TaxID=159417 RepID=A0ABP0G5E4_CLALP
MDCQEMLVIYKILDDLPRCQSSEFNCRCEDYAIGVSRECIPQSWVCDGQPDCSNGADEIDCRCDPGEYQCYGGVGVRYYKCINDSKVCNRGWNCVNFRDQRNEKCGGGFQCNNGRYIQSSYKCDGFNNCYDNSDENNYDCPQHRCDCYKEGNDTCADGRRSYNDEEDSNATYLTSSDVNAVHVTGATVAMSHACDVNYVPVSNIFQQKPMLANVCESSLKSVTFKPFTAQRSAAYMFNLQKNEKCNGQEICPDGSDEWNCPLCPFWQPYNCACNNIDNFSCKGSERVCYQDRDICDGRPYCQDGSDEWNCPSSCPLWEPNKCDCNKFDDYSCRGTGNICYENDEKYDGYPDCPDGSDEWNCPSCPSRRPYHCTCNKIDDYSCKGREPRDLGNLRFHFLPRLSGQSRRDRLHCLAIKRQADIQEVVGSTVTEKIMTCLGKTLINLTKERCDTRNDCVDSSDEMNCSCPEDKFTCSCFSKNVPTCNMEKGCIPMEYVNDGKLDCYSGNDEQYIKSLDKMSWGSCNFDVIRLENESFCIPPWCDNSTCTNVQSLECSKYDCNMTDAVCFSFCSEKKKSISNPNRMFQCTDQSIILDQNFCNGKEDCNDGSDEITSQPGFKCSAKFSTILCVLPQWNLYDDIPQCYDNSDFCFSSDGSFHCFKCLDNRLIISPKQVCDGVIDCFDLSDECLCENPSLPACLDVFSRSSQCNFFKFWSIESIDASNTLPSLQVGKDLMTCKNKQGDTLTVQCDGRPECLDFCDECISCPNPLAFCNDTCRTYFPMGDRYCDGYIDKAWKYLQDNNCSKGFDEKKCLKRFQCKAAEKDSIDILQKCDGMENCDDGIDENNCTNRHYCATKAGNLVSIPKSSVQNGKQECVDGSDEFIPGLFSSASNMIENLGLKTWLWFVTILTIVGNVSVAIISVKNLNERKRKDASVCNHVLIINLSVSDCLMGVYLMIILVKDVQFAARHASAKPWIIAAVSSWIISIIIALVSNTTRYFKSKVLFLNDFSSSDTVTHDYVTDFACRLAILTNTSQDIDESNWESVQVFLMDGFPQYAPRGEFGYYGTTSVCMPRLYVNRCDSFWIYSIVMITFNFLSFFFVFSGFTLIAWKLKKRPIQSNNVKKQNAKMNQRIARIIVSDFLCWVPICIMAYVSVSGVKLPDGVEIFTAGVLLPINSAFNPILYSPYIETKVEYLWKRIRPNGNQPPNRDAIELNVTS